MTFPGKTTPPPSCGRGGLPVVPPRFAVNVSAAHGLRSLVSEATRHGLCGDSTNLRFCRALGRVFAGGHVRAFTVPRLALHRLYQLLVSVIVLVTTIRKQSRDFHVMVGINGLAS